MVHLLKQGIHFIATRTVGYDITALQLVNFITNIIQTYTSIWVLCCASWPATQPEHLSAELGQQWMTSILGRDHHRFPEKEWSWRESNLTEEEADIEPSEPLLRQKPGNSYGFSFWTCSLSTSIQSRDPISCDEITDCV